MREWSRLLAEKNSMDITGINRATTSLHAPTPVEPVDKTAEIRDVVQAVRAVNGAEMYGPEYELRFQKDTASQKMVVRLVNRRTQEVVTQVPAEYVLRRGGCQEG
jgi:uncharacterized FlaG/YvyC family protein